MTRTGRIDVIRLIRIAAALFSFAAAFGVYATFEPQIDALLQRVDDNNSELRSDEVAASSATALRGERARLAERYATLVAQNSQAVFVRELATAVRRNGVTLLSTVVTAPSPGDAASPGALFTKTHLSVGLRGSYRRLLTTIADLSAGSDIVEVLPPSLTRETGAGDVSATVPLDIYEPVRGQQPPVRAENVR